MTLELYQNGALADSAVIIIKGDGDLMVVFVTTEKGKFVLSDGKLYSLDKDFVRTPVKDIECETSDKSVKYILPVSDLTDGDTVCFKAADSAKKYVRVEDFYDNGDVAPLGRLDFVFRFRK